MDAGALQEILEQAVESRSWIELHLHCMIFAILPTSVEARLGGLAVECAKTGRYEVEPPTFEETQSGEVMRSRLQSLHKRKGTLFVDPGEVLAAFTYRNDS